MSSSCLKQGYEVCLKESWEREWRVLLLSALLAARADSSSSHGAQSHCYPVRGR